MLALPSHSRYGYFRQPLTIYKNSIRCGESTNHWKQRISNSPIPNILWLTLQCLQNDGSESLETLAGRVANASTELREKLEELFNETDLLNGMQVKIENYRLDYLVNHTRNMFANMSMRNHASFSKFFTDARRMGPFCAPNISDNKIEPFFNNYMVNLNSFYCSERFDSDCNSDLETQLEMF